MQFRCHLFGHYPFPPKQHEKNILRVAGYSGDGTVFPVNASTNTDSPADAQAKQPVSPSRDTSSAFALSLGGLFIP